MINIVNTSDKTRHGYNHGKITGEFQQIIILNERDLENLEYRMRGISCDLIIVPRTLSEEQKKILEPCIMDGPNVIGKILELR